MLKTAAPLLKKVLSLSQVNQEFITFLAKLYKMNLELVTGLFTEQEIKILRFNSEPIFANEVCQEIVNNFKETSMIAVVNSNASKEENNIFTEESIIFNL